LNIGNTYIKDLTKDLNGECFFNSEMAPLTWLKSGGKADIFFLPYNATDLKKFLTNLKTNTPIYILGAGSNTLFRDLGYKGVVIKLSKNFDYIDIINKNEVRVGASTNCIKLARILAQKGATGLEFFSGIPGTVGGAIKMNAGAYKNETSDFLREIKVMNRKGQIKSIFSKNYKSGYRKTNYPNDYIFLEAIFQYKENKNIKQNLRKIEELVRKRKLTQPISEKTSGSTFKNTKNIKAWKLINKTGCNHYKVGKAKISEKHSNFIINEGGASSKDIEELGEKVRKQVWEKLKVNLDWEIKIVGEKFKDVE